MKVLGKCPTCKLALVQSDLVGTWTLKCPKCLTITDMLASKKILEEEKQRKKESLGNQWWENDPLRKKCNIKDLGELP